MQPSGELIDGKYQLVEIAGEGGMATVYKAVQKGAAGFQRTVAIKHIKPEYRALKNYVDMFIEEARVGSELAHPNIVQVHDFVIQDGNYYLVKGDFTNSWLHVPKSVIMAVWGGEPREASLHFFADQGFRLS